MPRVFTFLTNLGSGVVWALAAYVALISVYMAVVLCGAWLGRPRQRGVENQPSFVVIIPAHNEDQGIASTLRQIQQTDYPSEQISIVVICDNCTDRTAEVASQFGAQVLRRSDLANRGKGQALGWALAEHPEIFSGADLIAIIDADMDVHPGFFSGMARAFADADVQAAQGRYVIANPLSGLLPALGFASYCYVNHVRLAGRCRWGGTADLKGSGMAFRSRFLLPRGWNAHSIAEDVQLGKELMLEGIRVEFVPDAIVSSDIPSNLSQVRIQQSRWDGGKHQVIAAMFPRALAALFRRPSVLLLDGLLDMLVPPLSVVVMLDILGLAVGWWVAREAVAVFGGSLAIFGLAVLTGLILNRAPPGVYWRLASAPLFMVWKLGLLVRLALMPAETNWHRTPRNTREADRLARKAAID
ncbi:MAG: glycosyltransferase family 2 protein [Steroidobacteraceae bacterium]